MFNSSEHTDGKIKKINLEYNILSPAFGSSEMYKCLITRESEYDTNEVYRTYDEFVEFYQLLTKTYPSLRLEGTPHLKVFKETTKTDKRRQNVEALIVDITNLQAEISQSDIVYTFFHSILRDKKQDLSNVNKNEYKAMDDDLFTTKKSNLLIFEFDRELEFVYLFDLTFFLVMSDMDRDNDDYFNGPEIKGKIKIKLKFKDNKFYVNCLQCRNLVS